MRVLSIDCAGHGCGVCVWQDGHVQAHTSEVMERGQDQRLMPMIVEAIKQARTSFEKLDRIAVTTGPGSFTGLRIGLAAARGIGLAAGKPVIGIDRFSVYHEQVKSLGAPHLVAISSRRKELYCRFYPAFGASDAPTMMTVEEIAAFAGERPGIIITGDADLPNIPPAREAEVIACARLAAAVAPDDPAYLPRPLYIRAPDVTMPKHKVQGSGFGVRELSLTDAPLLTQLHAESFGEARWSQTQIEGSLALETTQCWGAYEGGTLTGFILCQIIPHQSEILTLCVRPSHRKRGYGEKLLRIAADEARNRQGQLYLEVAADNLAALGLYKKCGFVENGRRPNYYRHGSSAVDAVLMVLPVPQPINAR